MLTRRRPLSLVLLLALLVPLACGDDDDDGATAGDESTSTTRDRAGTATSKPRRAESREKGVIHLAPQGLAVAIEGEESTTVAFGSPRDDVVPAIRGILGRPAERGTQADCPAGEMGFVRFGDGANGLQVNLQEDAFVGWSIAADSDLQTADGIGIGSTKAELEERYGPVQVVVDSTIGIEFFIEGGFSGLLEADAPDGAITSLWAGITCIFR